MTPRFLVTLPVALVIGIGTAAAQDSRSADREAIRAHIDKIFKAYIAGDCATIRATHAKNWTGFTSFATSVMHGLDDYMSKSAEFCQQPQPGRSGLTDYKLTDIDYVFYGDVALVPYVADVSYGNFQGKLRSLDVYAKVNGEWNQVGSNIGPHPDMIQAQLEQTQDYRQLSPDERQTLLSAREALWRAVFANDRAALEKTIPEETIAIDAGTEKWSDRTAVLASAAEIAKSGGKLTRLEFPKTEIQTYGNVAIIYTTYLYELDFNGQKNTQSGRATEIFVRRKGTWVNSGWHLDSGK